MSYPGIGYDKRNDLCHANGTASVMRPYGPCRASPILAIGPGRPILPSGLLSNATDPRRNGIRKCGDLPGFRSSMSRIPDFHELGLRVYGWESAPLAFIARRPIPNWAFAPDRKSSGFGGPSILLSSIHSRPQLVKIAFRIRRGCRKYDPVRKRPKTADGARGAGNGVSWETQPAS